MPGKVPRWKVIHCRTCGKIIKQFDRRRYHGHVPQDAIMDAIRKHYKKKHPGKFKESIRKGLTTRRIWSFDQPRSTTMKKKKTRKQTRKRMPPRDKKGRFRKRKHR